MREGGEGRSPGILTPGGIFIDEKVNVISDWQSRRMMQAYKSNQSPILYVFTWNENSG